MTPPDSGEREALKRWEALHGGHSVACEEAAHQRECICGADSQKVSLPVPLAQRILAALESPALDGWLDRRDLADELRKEMGK